MEKIKNIIYRMGFSMILLLPSISAQAQFMHPTRDSQKIKQINVIENGNWDFEPKDFYWLFHKDYSGAYQKWEWAGFHSGLKIKFDENKSNIKRCFVPRTAAAAVEQIVVLKKTNAELDSITPIYKEEMAKSADRNVDLAYTQYSSHFKYLQNLITRNLKYCLEKSGGKLSEAVEKLSLDNDVICSSIEYIHKMGPGYELENTKREIAYEQANEEMEKILDKSCQLVQYVAVHYNKSLNGKYLWE